MANAILGSGITILIAVCIGVPVGFIGGIYLAEFGGSTMSFLVRYTADLLNGVPSVVIGIFAWTVVVVPMRGFSAWAGGFALSLMMIPIGLRNTEHFLRSIPGSLREGSLALGASKTRTILAVIVPAAKQGILTGMILGVARVGHITDLNSLNPLDRDDVRLIDRPGPGDVHAGAGGHWLGLAEMLDHRLMTRRNNNNRRQ